MLGTGTRYLVFPNDKLKDIDELVVYYTSNESGFEIVAARFRQHYEGLKVQVGHVVSSLQQPRSPETALELAKKYLNKSTDEIKSLLSETQIGSNVWALVNGLNIHHKYYQKALNP